jgi:hypothetical protein
MESNAGEIKGEQAVVSYEDEMAALDAFGPHTRHALCNAPISVLASAILEQVREGQSRGSFPANIRDRDIDAWLARRVLMGCYDLICRDRAERDARLAMQPLTPRLKLKRVR